MAKAPPAVRRQMKREVKARLKEFAKNKGFAMKEHIKKEKKQIVQVIINTIRDDIRNNSTNPKTGKPFKGLKFKSIQQRQRIAKKNPTHTNYAPARPNLTITGRFLDGMRGKLTGSLKKGFTVSLFFKGVHKKYKPLTKRKWINKPAKKAKVMNVDIHDRMISLGRDPLGLSKKMFKEVNKFIEKELLKVFVKK